MMSGDEIWLRRALGMRQFFLDRGDDLPVKRVLIRIRSWHRPCAQGISESHSTQANYFFTMALSIYSIPPCKPQELVLLACRKMQKGGITFLIIVPLCT